MADLTFSYKMRTSKNKKKPPKRISLSATPQTHEYVKNLASKLGISQLKCLSIIIEDKKHRDKLDSKRKAEEFAELDIQTAMNQINKRLERLEKRENPRDTIVSFFKTQEREILIPMKLDVSTVQEKLNELIGAIKTIQ